MAIKRKKLQDLYVTGREAKITGPQGQAVVWLQKLTAMEQDAVLRRANAARARMLMLKRDKESEEYQSAYSEACDFGNRETQIKYLVQQDIAELREARESELAASEEWSKDDYLQGLRDAFEGTDEEPGLRDAWLKDPEEPEAKRVFEELKRFADAAEALIKPEIDVLVRGYEGVSDEEIIDKVVETFIESRADSAWMRESGRAELYYAIRNPDKHSERYFDSPMEIDLLASEVLSQVAQAYQALKVDPLEGKDSAGTDGSSPSSVQPAPEAMDPSSGPQAVGQ